MKRREYDISLLTPEQRKAYHDDPRWKQCAKGTFAEASRLGMEIMESHGLFKFIEYVQPELENKNWGRI